MYVGRWHKGILLQNRDNVIGSSVIFVIFGIGHAGSCRTCGSHSYGSTCSDSLSGKFRDENLTSAVTQWERGVRRGVLVIVGLSSHWLRAMATDLLHAAPSEIPWTNNKQFEQNIYLATSQIWLGGCVTHGGSARSMPNVSMSNICTMIWLLFISYFLLTSVLAFGSLFPHLMCHILMF